MWIVYMDTYFVKTSNFIKNITKHGVLRKKEATEVTEVIDFGF